MRILAACGQRSKTQFVATRPEVRRAGTSLSADFFRVIIDIYRKKEEPPMRIIFKILAAPFVLVLTLLVAVLSFLLSLSAGLL